MRSVIFFAFILISFYKTYAPPPSYESKYDSIEKKVLEEAIKFIKNPQVTTIRCPEQQTIVFQHVREYLKGKFASEGINDELIMTIWQKSEIRSEVNNTWPSEFTDNNKFFLQPIENHPEFNVFKSRMEKRGINKEISAKYFKLIMDGLLKNKLRYESCFNHVKEEKQSPDMQYVSDVDRERFCKGDLDYENIDEFKKFAQDAKGLLKPVVRKNGSDKDDSDKDANPGFWSGGIGLSVYAKKNNFAMLETTPLGAVLNTLFFKKNWPGLNSMWNELSKIYAENVKEKLQTNDKAELHIFLRSIDKNSVLFRQELPQMQKGLSDDQKKRIKYRLVFGDNELEELHLDSNGNRITGDTRNAVYSDINKLEEMYNKFIYNQIKEPQRPTSLLFPMAVLYKQSTKDPRPIPKIVEEVIRPNLVTTEGQNSLSEIIKKQIGPTMPSEETLFTDPTEKNGLPIKSKK